MKRRKVDGTCVLWDAEHAGGVFMIPGQRSVFCHISAAPGRQPIPVGTVVRFSVRNVGKGPQAFAVEIPDRQAPPYSLVEFDSTDDAAGGHH
jgi:hypothetical protein